MKKFLLMLLCVMLLVVLASPAMAADFNLTATASKTTAYLGDEVTITISTSGTTPYTSMGFFLQYDTSVFEYKSRSWGAAIADANTKSFDADSGKVTAVWEDASAYAGEMIKITLVVKKATPGNTTITFSDAACKNENTDVTVGTNSVQIALACEHTYPKDPDGKFIYTQEGDKHKQTCEKCGTPKLEEHDWNDGEGNPSCDQASTIKYTCLICHTTKDENVDPIGHQYDNDCDSTCNNGCGTTRQVSHNYVLTTDEDAHWYRCSCGELKPGSWGTHTPGPAATESSAQVCTVCNYEIAPAISHEHVMETEWTTDSIYHWHRCEKKNPSCYHVADKAKHDYDNDCDVNCNTCGYIREAPHNYKPELQANAQGHWQVCVLCDAKSEVMEHVPGPAATDTEPQTCTECNFIIKMELSHVHDFGDTWHHDDDAHWQSCKGQYCSEVTSMEPHEWDEGTELEDGKMQYTCTVCAKQLVTDEPLGTEPSTAPTTQPPVTQKPTEPAESERFPWQWAGIAAIVLLIIGVVLLVIEFIRSRKTNMHGKFSK